MLIVGLWACTSKDILDATTKSALSKVAKSDFGEKNMFDA